MTYQAGDRVEFVFDLERLGIDRRRFPTPYVDGIPVKGTIEDIYSDVTPLEYDIKLEPTEISIEVNGVKNSTSIHGRVSIQENLIIQKLGP